MNKFIMVSILLLSTMRIACMEQKDLAQKFEGSRKAIFLSKFEEGIYRAINEADKCYQDAVPQENNLIKQVIALNERYLQLQKLELNEMKSSLIPLQLNKLTMMILKNLQSEVEALFLGLSNKDLFSGTCKLAYISNTTKILEQCQAIKGGITLTQDHHDWLNTVITNLTDKVNQWSLEILATLGEITFTLDIATFLEAKKAAKLLVRYMDDIKRSQLNQLIEQLQPTHTIEQIEAGLKRLLTDVRRLNEHSEYYKLEEAQSTLTLLSQYVSTEQSYCNMLIREIVQQLQVLYQDR